MGHSNYLKYCTSCQSGGDLEYGIFDKVIVEYLAY